MSDIRRRDLITLLGGAAAALPEDREHRSQWQRAAELLLTQADVVGFSKALELALFYGAKLDLAAIT